MLFTGFHDELVAIVFGLLAGIIAILTGTLLHHGWIARRMRADASRASTLLPVICTWICDPARSEETLGEMSDSDRRSILPMLVQLALDLRGEESERIGRLAVEVGLADAESHRLRSWRVTARVEAAKNLGLLRVRSALPALLQLVKTDRHFEVRHAGAWALGEIGGDEAVSGLLALLEDPHPGVVRRAQELLLETGPDCVGKVIENARVTRVPAARRAAIEILGVLRDPGATALLLELADDSDSELRIKAIKSAAAIADPRALGAFEKLIRDPLWEIRCQAATGLGALGSAASIPALRNALADEEWWVRFNSARALYEMGHVGRRVLEAVSHERNSRSGEVARYVLERSDSTRMAA